MSEQTEPKTKEKDPYKESLNLPKTAFAMRANLTQMEPQIQKGWEEAGIYKQSRAIPHPSGAFVFHDGPPYANGSIHMGHLLNKVLKDLVVRSRMMAGYDVDFVPGWDCHGLPIEHRVMKDLGDKAREMTPLKIRYKCKDYAEKHIKLQAEQMKRLGTLGDYEAPYKTMDPAYEGAVIEVFAALVGEGLVYRALKPVHWSVANQTALAEAELEYESRRDISIYVLFELESPSSLPASLQAPQGAAVSLMIWTTTPWTLPANLAVAAASQASYGLYRYVKDGQTRYAILAEDLHAKVFSEGGASFVTCLGVTSGHDLAAAKLVYRHPFVDRKGPVVLAEYVTTTDGTGLVHTAPGHGIEDYQTGMREGLPIYCPVLADGTYDTSVPSWLEGKDIWAANPQIVEHLRSLGVLFYDHFFVHSYPHDWRSKTPTIFRATDQWFIGVDMPTKATGKTLREMALHAAAGEVAFVPDWGENRLRGMLEARPDWCISRQRAWGLPIPAFYDAQDRILLTVASVNAVAQAIRKHGSDIWFKAEAKTLLESYRPADDPDAPAWLVGEEALPLASLRKSSDIFDVWFESGASWHAVLRERKIGYPADLYLEGSDQHRGWFQLSLLPALGATGQAPFKTVLTHGFMVDGEGKKMSKSVGNTIEVEDLLKKHGADVCRWWVSSLNYTNDIKVDWAFFQVASEEYRKIRNTIRFLLGNLYDFDPQKHRHVWTEDDRYTLDFWAHHQLQALIETVSEGYKEYSFRRVRESIFLFCNEILSAVYMAATKDRLYCEASTSPLRRRIQTVMYDTTDALLRLLGPVLVHTAEEAWRELQGDEAAKSLHLQRLPKAEAVRLDVMGDWSAIFEIRESVLKALEENKAQGISNFMDAGVRLTLPAAIFSKLKPYEAELTDLCNVSRFKLVEGDEMAIALDDLRGEPRCQRSWKRDETVKMRSNGHFLSERDAHVMGLA